MTLSPYLTFDGRCEEAFGFYAACLDTKIVAMMRHEGTPMAEHVPPEWADKLLHAQLAVGNEILMGSDAPPDRYLKPQGMTVSLQIKDPAEADRVFQALSDGGSVQMPIQKTFWAQRFGMLVDRFDIPWMVNCD